MALDSEQLSALSRVFEMLKDTSRFHDASSFTVEMEDAILRLLSWPHEEFVPILDLLRCLALHSGSVSLGEHLKVRESLCRQAPRANDTNAMLLLMFLCNWTAKRDRTLSEKKLETPEDKGYLMFVSCTNF